MTDREPDDLYDALRDRLAGYGQEPPAPLWAGIRAQLPPPAARPQLRRRRHAALLALLLVVAGGVGWLSWRAARPGHRASPQLAQQSLERPAREATAAGAALLQGPPPTSPRAAAPLLRARIGAHSAAKAAEATEVAAGTASAASSSAAALATSAAATPAATSFPGSSAAASRQFPDAPAQAGAGIAGAVSATAATRKPAGRLPVAQTASIAARHWPATASAGTAPSRRAEREDAGDTATARLQPYAARRGQRPSGTPTEDGNRAAGAAGLAASGALPAATGLPAVGIVTASAKAAEATAEAAVSPVAGPTDGLAPRAVAVQPPTIFPPSPRLRADTVPGNPAPTVRRWAALLLAGPALTHRQLGEAPAASYPGARGFDLYGQPLATTERASTGFGAQAQLRRVLTGRWALSAGLGYQEYASRTVYAGAIYPASIPPSTTASPRTVPAYSHRDTYRFGTVPVRVAYALGRAAGPWRCGLLAGADAALYLGGSSTRDSAGVARTWGPTGSPYRPLSLSLSAGLDLRYRLAPHLAAVAQPTATYFLAALSRPETGLAPRRLVGVEVLVGVAYELW